MSETAISQEGEELFQRYVGKTIKKLDLERIEAKNKKKADILQSKIDQLEAVTNRFQDDDRFTPPSAHGMPTFTISQEGEELLQQHLHEHNRQKDLARIEAAVDEDNTVSRIEQLEVCGKEVGGSRTRAQTREEEDNTVARINQLDVYGGEVGGSRRTRSGTRKKMNKELAKDM